MQATSSFPPIAYLAPEIPALTATFVHEELLALERRGVPVLSYSVHLPSYRAPGQDALAARTEVLYRAHLGLVALAAIPGFGARAFTALSWLARDMRAVGLGRSASWKLVYQWLAGAVLGRSMKRRGVTHLHVHFAHVPAQIGMYASAFTGIPFTIEAHANDIFERGLLLPEKARRSTKMLTISEYNVAYLRAAGVPDAKLSVVRCGVSFATRPEAPRFERRHRYRIGTLGRLVEKKGVDDLLRAVAMLRDASWEMELSIAGDGPLRATLESLVDELGLRDRVRFEGALAHGDVSAWMHTLDVFALACRADAQGDMDGIPVVLMEAMSQRVPVVSTRLSGIPELVLHERTGLLAAPRDPVGLADQLRRVLDEPTLRQELTEAAARHVETEFGQRTNLDRLMVHFAGSVASAPLETEAAVPAVG